MGSLDLSTNFGKSHVMVCGPGKKNVASLPVKDRSMSSVSNFSYLGVTYNSGGSWQAQFIISRMKLNKEAGTFLNLSCSTFKGSAAPFIKIYNHQCVPAAVYGAGVWGYLNPAALQTKENHICR